MWRRPAWQTLLKALDISSATARVVPGLLKALAILSDVTVKRSAVDRENLKPYWKSGKSTHFSRWSTSLLFGSFFKDFTNHSTASLSEVYFRFRRFILVVQTKKFISMNYGSSASSWKPWILISLFCSSFGNMSSFDLDFCFAAGFKICFTMVRVFLKCFSKRRINKLSLFDNSTLIRR